MKPSLLQAARAEITQRLAQILAAQGSQLDPNWLKWETPPQTELGHVALACFPFAKAWRKAPPQIAQDLAAAWGSQPLFAQVQAAGPYLNFFFSAAALISQLPWAQTLGFGHSHSGQGKRLLLEYSSPNTNKPLHLGHGRNNLLGMCLARLLETQGYEVVKVNLVNDRGIHICKSMLAYQKWGQGATPASRGQKGDHLVGDFYVLYDQKLKEQPELETEVQALLRAWEAGDAKTLALWEQMNAWVYAGFQDTYQRLGCEFDRYYYESQTYQGGKELVLQAREQGICQREDNGAISIDLEADGLGKKILLRGDGTSMYITQDLSTTVTKFKDYGPLEAALFVVGNEQDNHFRVLFKTLERFGFTWATACEHISYGMITLPEGKMKSREGTVVDLDDLLNSLRDLALAEIETRANFGPEDADLKLPTAEAVGQAALKFFILRSGAPKEIQFNPKESLSFEGQTGPYLQYVHARISSLLAKAAQAGIVPQPLPETLELHPAEQALLLHLAHYQEELSTAAHSRNPAVLANWVYGLCKLFNQFYFECRILDEAEPARSLRLHLARACQTQLAQSLTILGIVPLNKM